ncbi:hypothetical protein E2C01_013438 [Portunus trituberculatus]|uniref:Uncharacterized protein n=1 Tax=Portunus trituberculatus TaxID=210409 RepID=A0A5B7DH51_PORTR|nr:hypothetical protein [Portunus trituberculatus]
MTPSTATVTESCVSTCVGGTDDICCGGRLLDTSASRPPSRPPVTPPVASVESLNAPPFRTVTLQPHAAAASFPFIHYTLHRVTAEALCLCGDVTETRSPFDPPFSNKKDKTPLGETCRYRMEMQPSLISVRPKDHEERRKLLSEERSVTRSECRVAARW